MAEINLLGITATSDAFKVEKWMTGLASQAGPVAGRVIAAAGNELRAEIRKNAQYPPWGSGLSPNPGPAKQTGVYWDSWQITLVPELNGGTTAVIGTDAPQGRRLEWGFSGTDSLGRVYHQRPFPHVGPALDKVEPTIAPRLFEAVVHD